MKDFYLTLLSDSSLHMYPDNKQNSFTVKLDHPIQIEKELWEVALVEMITPSQILNISEENNYFFLRFYDRSLAAKIDDVNCTYDGSCSEIDLKIPKGNYHSPYHLVEEIQNIIDRRYGTHLKQSNASITISYAKNSRRVKVHSQDPNQVKIFFPTQLAEKLGVNPNFHDKAIGNERHAFKYGVDLNTSYHQLHVYSDIESYTYIGDVTAPVLRVVPFQQTKSETHSHQEFLNLHYVPVAKSYIDQVHISIKGDTGYDVPFITGKSLIKLHFGLKEN